MSKCSWPGTRRSAGVQRKGGKTYVDGGARQNPRSNERNLGRDDIQTGGVSLRRGGSMAESGRQFLLSHKKPRKKRSSPLA